MTKDDGLEKIGGAEKCLATVNFLRQQVASLKAIGLADSEREYAQTSLVLIGRLQSCLENLLSKIQKNFIGDSQSRDAKHKASRSIKP
jgi:hypothetical protein